MSQPTVLVVEDEKDILELVEFNLTQAGMRVLKAADGANGLKLALGERPDLWSDLMSRLKARGLPAAQQHEAPATCPS